MSKTKDPVNFVVVGSRYQVVNQKGETLPEFGVGRFRSGIQLELAMDLYGRMIAASTTNISYPTNVEAKRLAASAFSLSEAFLDEMDKHFRMPVPPENNGRR
jgi:hypothetical protein